MRQLLTIILTLAALAVVGQSKKTIAPIGTYQFFELEAISVGLEYQIDKRWENLNFDHQVQMSLQGQFFLNQTDTDQDKYYGVINDVHFCTKFFGLGGQFRIIFQDNRQRYEFGPSFKLGYKYVWLNYVWSGYNFGNNPFKHHRDVPPIEFHNGDHNIRLILSIPVLKLK